MATRSEAPREYFTGDRRHRRILYRVQMSSPFKHDRDIDIIDGIYADTGGEPLGRLIVPDTGRTPDAFLVLPHEDIPLVHAEAALEADSRVSGYEQVFGLLYDPGEEPVQGVVDMGERWAAGDLVVYAFETDQEALEAQELLSE